MSASEAFLSAFFALPVGTFHGRSAGKTYVVSRLTFVRGRSHKLVAHQLDGPDYVSLNLYQTIASGALLRPCEMPAAKVVDFVLNLVVYECSERLSRRPVNARI